MTDSAARCALCCIHGQPLTSWCGWCEDTDSGHMDPLDLSDPHDLERASGRTTCALTA